MYMGKLFAGARQLKSGYTIEENDLRHCWRANRMVKNDHVKQKLPGEYCDTVVYSLWETDKSLTGACCPCVPIIIYSGVGFSCYLMGFRGQTQVSRCVWQEPVSTVPSHQPKTWFKKTKNKKHFPLSFLSYLKIILNTFISRRLDLRITGCEQACLKYFIIPGYSSWSCYQYKDTRDAASQAQADTESTSSGGDAMGFKLLD